MFFLRVITLAVAALAAPVNDKRGKTSSPTVTIQNGTIVGTSILGMDSFNSIPYAQPPVGPLRLKPPRPVNKSFGKFDATVLPNSCPQNLGFAPPSGLPSVVTSALNNFTAKLGGVAKISEDCLTLNIQRPAGTSSNSKLPVLFWIFGGGFEIGSAQIYNGASILPQAVLLGKPFIFVAINYRVGGFGFLAGKELQADGSTNLGLRDQRLALQWVQDNIGAFGGDPQKVTIWGESAGSISVFDQMIINNGDHTYKGKPMFRAAIMDSGSAVPTNDVADVVPQGIFNAVASAAGCGSKSDKLSCLRQVDYPTFLAATNSVPSILSYRTLDLSYLPRPDPHDNFFPKSPDEVGKIAQVPFIIGDQEDEGSLFAALLGNVTSRADFESYLRSYFTHTDPSLVHDLANLYPDDPSAGSPFNTGSLNELYPGFKRNAAFLGDAVFTLARRVMLGRVASNNNLRSWTYLSSYFKGTPFLGTFHATDVFALFFGLGPPQPIEAIKSYYIGMIHDLDPNKGRWGLPNWPTWDPEGRAMMHFQTLFNNVEKDNFREDIYQYFAANASKFRV